MNGVSGVSVVIPCYNNARYVAQAAESALGQTTPPAEVIVVDDASADDPAAALAHLGDRVTLVRRAANGGRSAALNAGFERSKGEVVMPLDADDWLPGNFLEKIAGQVRQGRAVSYDCKIMYESGKRPGATSILGEWLRTSPSDLNCGNMHLIFKQPNLLKSLVHRADWQRVGGFDERFRNGQDFHFTTRLLASHVELHISREATGFYRHHAGSTLRTIGSDRARARRATLNWRLMFESLLSEVGLSPLARRECERMRRYYRARDVMEQIRAAASARSPAAMSGGFTRDLIAAAPQVARMAAKGLRRRVIGP